MKGLFVLFSFFCVAFCLDLSFFLVLDDATSADAVDLNLEITSLLPHNEIYLYNNGTPHITLYEASFDSKFLGIIMETFERYMESSAKKCSVVLDGGSIFARFIEWNVQPNPCLSLLNEGLVEKLRLYREYAAPIPEWVIEYPDDDIRDSMTEDFIYSGFPFFAENFRTGVTVGYDFKEPIAFVLDELQFKSKTIVPKSIGIAIAEKNDFINSVGILNEIDFKN